MNNNQKDSQSQQHLSSSPAAVFLPQDHFLVKVFLGFLFLGGVGVICACLFGHKQLESFYISFHLMWVFFISIVMGAVFFVLIQYASKAAWSVTVRRVAESVSIMMPVFLLFLPFMYFGSSTIYQNWMSPTAVAADAVLQQKTWYLNPTFFYIRSIVYIVLFSWAAIFFARGSAQQDQQYTYAPSKTLQHASYPWLIILGFMVTFAAFDWLMSLTPLWYSTIFGLYFFAGGYVAFLALLSVLTWFLRDVDSLRSFFHGEHIHDLGKLVFGHSCFWAYAGFCQYLLIWYGNLPEETIWYHMRQQHDWFWVWSLLCVGHFIVPFLLLMSRASKRSPCKLLFVSLWVLFMHFVDIVWLVLPVFYPQGPHFSWVDFFWFIGFFGLLFGVFSWRIRQISVVPIRDPLLQESLTYTNI